MRLLLAFILLLPSVAMARDTSHKEYLNFYAGYFDIVQQDDEAFVGGVDYRYKDIFYGLRPGVGFLVTSDKAVYGHVGFAWDIYLTDNIIVTPNLAVGAFTQGDGRDLGHAVEFRDGIELAYQFERGSRLGLHFNHMSNASIGDDNPGTEILMLMYSHPFNAFAPNRDPVKRAKYHEPSGEKRWWHR